MYDLDTNDLIVGYTITPDLKFRTMAAESIFSLVRLNPQVRVQVTETDGGNYPIGIKNRGMKGKTDSKWALLLDADTRVRCPLSALKVSDDVQFYGRHETMWTRNRIRHDKWADICEAAGTRLVPVYNSGAFLLRGYLVRHIGRTWPWWMTWLRWKAEDPLAPGEAAKRYEWWMLEQCALSLAVSELRRKDWTRHEHSYQWQGEEPGVIHHCSSKRWKPALGRLK